jgi:hypothetical protein
MPNIQIKVILYFTGNVLLIVTQTLNFDKNNKLLKHLQTVQSPNKSQQLSVRLN